MKIFDSLFGKKGKDSKVGAFYRALEVPFRPHQCPNCRNYSREIKRCAAFTQPTPPVGEMLAMFSGESKEDCVRFETLPKLNMQELIRNKDVQGLIQALQHGDSIMQSRASAALCEIGKPAVESLILALKNVNPKVRWFAVCNLGKIGDARAVAPLINTIRTDSDRDVRWHAVDALGEIGDVSASNPLTQVLNDKDTFVRGAAKEALNKIKFKNRHNF